MPNQPLDKRYYTIGEVAEMFQVSKSLIRFWENEFDSLRPHKNSKGDRRFTPQNIRQFELIHELVKERGFTLEGAKQEIKRQQKFQKKKAAMLNSLQEVKSFLEQIRDQAEEEE
ncbi:MAG: MerR family transcriptional regulator [Bacteroidota bacterium]